MKWTRSQDFSKEVGIRKGTTIPYNPKQNGVAERKNKTTMEAVKAMFLLGEIANATVYVQNKSPHPALNNKTLEEVFLGEKLEGGHLRIFGYLVYFHVPKVRRNKLEAFGKKGTFVGYYENPKAYRIYVPRQRNIEFSKDLTFDEDASLGKARDTPLPFGNFES